LEKQKKPILFKVNEPSSVPYRAPPACAKMAAYPDPPPVILLPESIVAQAAYQLRYKNTEYYSWVGSGPKCFQVLGLSLILLQNPMLVTVLVHSKSLFPGIGFLPGPAQ
jgi:hypothetical protein